VLKISQPYRAEFTDEPGRPIIEHLADRHVVGDPEREIQIREPITVPHSERTHDRAGHHPVILRSEPQHPLAQGSPLLDRERESPPPPGLYAIDTLVPIIDLKERANAASRRQAYRGRDRQASTDARAV
jgi:hypothetical protein